ncbi:MAG: phospholipid carrier-dependent glycosyltransferase [Pirellulaceae bacterium]
MRQPIFIVVFLLIAMKVALWVSLGPSAIVGDAHGYWNLTSLVVDGDVMMMGEPIAFRTPIYPWFLAVLRSVSSLFTSPLLGIVVCQALLSIAAVYLACELAVKISRRNSARTWTALAMLPTVSALTYNGFLVTEVFFVFMLMLNLHCVIAYSEKNSRQRAVLSAGLVGLTLGLTLLTRPVVLLLWIPHLFFVLAKHFTSPNADEVTLKHRCGHAMLAAAVVVTLCVPWMVRNQRLFGEMFLTEFLGRNIWIVTFQDGSGAGLSMPESKSANEIKQRIIRITGVDWQDTNWRHTWTVSKHLKESGLSDPAADRLMKTVAVEAMKTDIAIVSFKAVRRIVNFWRCPASNLPVSDPAYQGFTPYPKTWSTENQAVKQITGLAFRFRVSQSVAANTIVMILIGAACFVLIWRRETRVAGLWIVSILAYFSVITGIVEIPDYRYRMVVEPLCATAVGSAMSLLWTLQRNEPSESTSDLAA